MLPNRNKFTDDLFHANDLYTSVLPTESPTTTPSPTLSPTSSPIDVTVTTSPSLYTLPCSDSPLRFRIVKPNGSKIWRDCEWVANRSTNLRCSWGDVSSICPVTCQSCEPCGDATGRFRLDYNGDDIARDCGWVANKATAYRCKSNGVPETCPATCGLC